MQIFLTLHWFYLLRLLLWNARFVGLISVFALALLEKYVLLIDWRGPNDEYAFLFRALNSDLDMKWKKEYENVGTMGELGD